MDIHLPRCYAAWPVLEIKRGLQGSLGVAEDCVEVIVGVKPVVVEGKLKNSIVKDVEISKQQGSILTNFFAKQKRRWCITFGKKNCLSIY
jgi:hypothetical protein